MTYIFDTGSFSKLKHFYPGVFKSVWLSLDQLVTSGQLLSTREVWHDFVAKILSIPHFQTLIGEKQRLMGLPVADPFVIACAQVHGGTVVSEEKPKPNSAKIPTVCEYFGIPCINMEAFMHIQGWEF